MTAQLANQDEAKAIICSQVTLIHKMTTVAILPVSDASGIK
jgi:hypothetical protein